MKNLRYIISVLALVVSVSVLAKQYTGVVLLVDEPVKGAKIMDQNDKVLAVSDKEGKFSFESDIKANKVVLKKLSQKVALKAKQSNKVILVPAEDKLLSMIEEAASLTKCQIFLANYKSSEEFENVVAKKEDILFSEAYLAAVKEYNVAKLESYLKMYDNAKYQEKAEKTLEVISWQKARLNNSFDSYQEYLAKFPDSETAPEAAQRLAEVEN